MSARRRRLACFFLLSEKENEKEQKVVMILESSIFVSPFVDKGAYLFALLLEPVGVVLDRHQRELKRRRSRCRRLKQICLACCSLRRKRAVRPSQFWDVPAGLKQRRRLAFSEINPLLPKYFLPPSPTLRFMPPLCLTTPRLGPRRKGLGRDRPPPPKTQQLLRVAEACRVESEVTSVRKERGGCFARRGS